MGNKTRPSTNRPTLPRRNSSPTKLPIWYHFRNMKKPIVVDIVESTMYREDMHLSEHHMQ